MFIDVRWRYVGYMWFTRVTGRYTWGRELGDGERGEVNGLRRSNG